MKEQVGQSVVVDATRKYIQAKFFGKDYLHDIQMVTNRVEALHTDCKSPEGDQEAHYEEL